MHLGSTDGAGSELHNRGGGAGSELHNHGGGAAAQLRGHVVKMKRKQSTLTAFFCQDN